MDDVIETVDLDRVRPYWRNPRRVTEDAVTQLMASISEYGYQQPIVVDSDYVIIVGHTRYAALRRLNINLRGSCKEPDCEPKGCSAPIERDQGRQLAIC